MYSKSNSVKEYKLWNFQINSKKCHRVTYDDIKKEKLSIKIMGRLLKAVAPLM